MQFRHLYLHNDSFRSVLFTQDIREMTVKPLQEGDDKLQLLVLTRFLNPPNIRRGEICSGHFKISQIGQLNLWNKGTSVILHVYKWKQAKNFQSKNFLNLFLKPRLHALRLLDTVGGVFRAQSVITRGAHLHQTTATKDGAQIERHLVHTHSWKEEVTL